MCARCAARFVIPFQSRCVCPCALYYCMPLCLSHLHFSSLLFSFAAIHCLAFCFIKQKLIHACTMCGQYSFTWTYERSTYPDHGNNSVFNCTTFSFWPARPYTGDLTTHISPSLGCFLTKISALSACARDYDGKSSAATTTTKYKNKNKKKQQNSSGSRSRSSSSNINTQKQQILYPM